MCNHCAVTSHHDVITVDNTAAHVYADVSTKGTEHAQSHMLRQADQQTLPDARRLQIALGDAVTAAGWLGHSAILVMLSQNIRRPLCQHRLWLSIAIRCAWRQAVSLAP